MKKHFASLLMVLFALGIFAPSAEAQVFKINQLVSPVTAGFVYSSGVGTTTLIASSTPNFPNFTFGNATGTNATTTNLFSTKGNFTTLCIAADCKTAWPSSGGSGTVGTSSAETSGRIPFWTTTGADTALLSGGVSGFSWDNTLSRLTATNLSVTLSTTTSATSTNLFSTRGVITSATTTNFAITGITSALHLADSSGNVTAYAGSSCTNQFVRSLSALGAATCATVGAADVSLANLTATDSTLTFSGTYNGSAARTIGINLANGNVWTASTTFAFLNANLSTTTSASTTNLFATKAVFTSSTSTNDASTNGTITNLNFTLATGTAATSTNMAGTNLTFTNSTSTNIGSTNTTITNATTTNLFSTTASSTNLFTHALGVASSTPSFAVSVNGAINVAENTPATSTSMTVDWSAGNQQLIKIGTSAVTIGFSNAVAGAHETLIICTPPSGTAGAVTFTGVLWPGGTAPTTTTTAKKCDIITLLSTFATTTGPQILGGFNQNY